MLLYLCIAGRRVTCALRLSGVRTFFTKSFLIKMQREESTELGEIIFYDFLAKKIVSIENNKTLIK